MPLQATSGAASYDAFGGGVPAPLIPYIEDVFSTYLYTGTGAAQTITNNIDLSGKGGLVWIKNRTMAAQAHALYDTVRGVENCLKSNTTAATDVRPGGLTTFSSSGFSVGTYDMENNNGSGIASWTFRKQPKFFDVVTWTGDGSGTRTITHNLQGTVGCVIAKRLDTTSVWVVQHRALTNAWTAARLFLNTTDAVSAYSNFTNPTNTTIDIDSNLNVAGAQWVAYFFAHNAGGFGLTGTDNVISCGSFTTDASGVATITTGYEPQWILAKPSSTTGGWLMYDSMRGLTNGGASNAWQELVANSSAAESAAGVPNGGPTATGFITGGFQSSQTYIYIAIRRGPMKVPTSGTSVFSPVATTTNNTITTNFPVDLSIFKADKTTTSSNLVFDRLRGNTARLVTSTTGAEATATAYPLFDNNTGTAITGFSAGLSGIDWAFRRAPSFFDEVCYTGTGVTHTETHNLGVAPELIIVKRRASATASWAVYAAPLTASYVGFLDLTNAFQADNMWNSTAPTSTAFTVRAANVQVNASGSTYVAYLFATCAGVQYINSYVGDGTTGRTINCGFTGGARFVCIRATSTSGSWWTFDSARGIVTNSDPALQLNSTAAEVTSADAIDTASSGFIVNQEATCSLNASGVSYLVWAIA